MQLHEFKCPQCDEPQLEEGTRKYHGEDDLQFVETCVCPNCGCVFTINGTLYPSYHATSEAIIIQGNYE